MDIKKEFEITTKTPDNYLGMKIQEGEDVTIKIKQKFYIETVLEKFNIGNYRPVLTPKVRKDVEGNNVTHNSSVRFPYRQVVRSVLYLL